jgi:hypothetical protein
MVMKKIFVSYSHEDASPATQITRALEEAGFRLWIDQQEIRPGDSFLERMNEGLEDASYFLLLLSSAAVSSRWVTKEWMATLASGGTVIIPVRLDDTPLPLLLRDVVYVDMRPNMHAGVEEIVRFFRREISEVSPRLRTSVFSLKHLSRRQLRLLALACLDELGLSSFCFDSQLDPRSLSGSSVHEKLVYLMHVAASEGLLESFAEWLEAERSKCLKQQIKTLENTPAWNWVVT